ncbi:MAG: hypothetical protein NTY88_03965 [Bacteroidetes bacterium]|nr:hypothetical protein [Bacteroidota bacterium]
MAHSDLLHQLIHSLSKTEKKYFKEFSGGQNYVKLFDAINDQPEYDEEKLKKKFKHEAFTNNFSAAKKYLEEAIFRALRNFNSGKLMDDVSYERLQNLKLLYEKGLISAVEKQLPKLKAFCYEYEQFPRLLEILSFEMQFNNSGIRSNEKLYEERLRLIKIISNITYLNQIYGELILIATNRGHNIKSENERIETLMQNPLLKEEALYGLPDELYALRNVFFVYHYLMGNFRESYLAKKKQFELTSQNNVLIKTKPKTQLLLIGNLVSLAYNIPDASEFEFAYREMQNAHTQVQGFEGLKFEQRSTFGLLYCKVKQDYSDLEQHVKYIEENLRKHEGDITLVREMDTYFNVAVAYFRKKDFGKAIDWLNKILNHERTDERQQINRYARLLELLAHYELKNFELLDYKITNTQRYLAKRNLGDEFDKVLLNGFRHLIKAADKKETQKIFQDLKSSIQKISKDDLQKINEEQFEYLNWMEEKLKQK